MDYFGQKRFWSSFIKNVKFGYRKLKGAGGRIKEVNIELYIRINDEIREHCADPLRKLMAISDSEAPQDFLVGKLQIKQKYTVVAKIFGSDGKGSPVVTCGAENHDEAYLSVKEFVPVENNWFIKAVLSVTYRDELWAWIGRTFIEGECMVETDPFQRELELSQDEEEVEEEEQGTLLN